MIIKQLEKIQDVNNRARIANGLFVRSSESLKNTKVVNKKRITKAVNNPTIGKASVNTRGPTKSNCLTTKAAWVAFMI